LLILHRVKLLTNDPRKQYLIRVLNACFVDPRPPLLEFLYRLIQGLLMDQEYFESFKYYESAPVVFQEFRHQFEKEWNFCPAIWYSTVQPDYGYEWLQALHYVREVECANPILDQAWPVHYPS